MTERIINRFTHLQCDKFAVGQDTSWRQLMTDKLEQARRRVGPTTWKGQPENYDEGNHKIEERGRLKGRPIFNNGWARIEKKKKIRPPHFYFSNLNPKCGLKYLKMNFTPRARIEMRNTIHNLRRNASRNPSILAIVHEIKHIKIILYKIQ